MVEPTGELSMRRQVLCCLLTVLLVSTAKAAKPLTIRVEDPIALADNSGDTWVAAWAADGTVYTPSDDTKGFHSAANSNIAFNRITGDDVRKLSGVTVDPMSGYGKASQKGPDGCTWKSSGCYCLDGTLYCVVARHKYGEDSGDPKRRQPAADASIIKSTDFGKTWTRSAKENYDQPMFPGSRFTTPYFVEYGQDGRASVDNADRYVYALSNDGFWDNGNNLILGRVARSKIGNLSASDWRYYKGGDGMEDSAWTSDMARAKLVLDAPGKLGMNGAVYVPGLRRYFMIGWYYPAGGGKIKDACHTTNWDFYEAPRPWGPWTKTSTYVFSPQGYYSPQLCPKFTSDDGRRLFVMTAGDWNQGEYYRLTIVPLRVEGE
ncbi:MAG: hypothetical protein ABSG53_25845 [Thermoguttaceae bacterium]